MLKSIATAHGECTTKHENKTTYKTDYIAPASFFEIFFFHQNSNETYFIKILSDSITVNETFFLAGDFNTNLLDFETNKKVQNFVNLIFEFSMTPTINKPTRVTKHTATVIDHIITNCILNIDFKSAIVKADLYDHFPIIFINEFKRDPTHTDDTGKCAYKRDFNESASNCFKVPHNYQRSKL